MTGVVKSTSGPVMLTCGSTYWVIRGIVSTAKFTNECYAHSLGGKQGAEGDTVTVTRAPSLPRLL